MNKNLDIFIITHRDFEKKPTNSCYKIVSIEDFDAHSNLEHIICDKSKDDILKKEHGYSELARIHYIWKNYQLKDYVGTAHYRRYFDFWNDIPNIEEIFKEHDAILPTFNLGWENVYGQYSCCHCKKDILTTLEIIARYYPDFFEAAIDTIVFNKFYPCNLFILKKETFIKWCDFVFGVLEKFDNIRGFKTDEDILNYVKANKETYITCETGQNSSINYQTRIEAFLSERLSTIFFVKNIKNPYMTKMALTEVHDEYEKEYYNYRDDLK